jgi:hypothetical protein
MRGLSRTAVGTNCESIRPTEFARRISSALVLLSGLLSGYAPSLSRLSAASFVADTIPERVTCAKCKLTIRHSATLRAPAKTALSPHVSVVTDRNGRFFASDAFQEGEDHLHGALAGLSIDQLKDIIAEHGMDTDKLAMKWKGRDRIIALIVTTVKSRMAKGDAFRPLQRSEKSPRA